jgi:hypothetical protein
VCKYGILTDFSLAECTLVYVKNIHQLTVELAVRPHIQRILLLDAAC